MEEKNRNTSLENLDAEGRAALEMVIEFSRQVGRAENAYANENINRMARLKALKTIQDKQLYRYLPGGKTMRDAFPLAGYGKTTGYQDLKALETLGDKTVELLMDIGVTSQDSYLLAKALESTEDGEFEVLDRESGEYRIGGQVVTMDGDRGLISDAMLRTIQRVKLEQDARRGVEAELEKRDEQIGGLKTEIKLRDQKIAAGEQMLITLFQERMLAVQLAVGQLRNTTLSPRDEEKIKQYWSNMVDTAINPLKGFFDVKTREIEAREAEARGEDMLGDF